MNTTSTQNRPSSRGQQRSQSKPRQAESLSLDNIRQRLEDHVTGHPLKAVGQAMAVGYLLRFLPLRMMFSTALRLAPPLMLASRLWQGSLFREEEKKE